MRLLASLLLLWVGLCAGCGEDTVTTLPVTDVMAETSAVDSTAAVDSTSPDTAADDSSTVDSATDSTATDTATSDVPFFDAPVGEVGGTFTCAGETCSTTLQYCRRATSPGTCPPPDSGICPAGCPGCPALSLKCETMPMKCWAKPSCNCILVETCGSVANGTCMEKDGGFVASCNGV